MSPWTICSSRVSQGLGQNLHDIISSSSLLPLHSSHSGSSKFCPLTHQARNTKFLCLSFSHPTQYGLGYAHRRKATQMQTHIVWFPYLKNGLFLRFFFYHFDHFPMFSNIESGTINGFKSFSEIVFLRAWNYLLNGEKFLLEQTMFNQHLKEKFLFCHSFIARSSVREENHFLYLSLITDRIFMALILWVLTNRYLKVTFRESAMCLKLY